MAIQSLFQNGGYVGTTRDFYNTSQLEPSPVFVGGQAGSTIGTIAAINVTFSLTDGISGGTAATLQEGDVVVVAFATASTVDRVMVVNSNGGTAYTNITDLYANSSFDTNLCVAYRVMPATPDTGISFPSGTFATSDAASYAIHVWRYVDPTTPIDVTSTTTTSATSALSIPPAITTATNGAIIIGVTASAHNGGIDTYNSTQLLFFESSGNNATNDSSVGMGSYRQVTAGTFTPTVFSFTNADSTTFSSAAVTLALRPKYPVGKRYNSGIWNMQSVYDKEAQSLTLVSTLTYSQTVDSATHYVSLPTNLTPGNLLLMCLNADATSTASIAPDYGTWTQIANDSTYDEAYVFAKIVDDEDVQRGYIRIDLSTAQNLVVTFYNITGNAPDVTTNEIAVSTVSTAATTTPNPGPVQTPWHPAENFFLAVAFGNDGNMTLSAYPTNYTIGQTFNRSTVGGVGSTAISALRKYFYTSDDPGAFTTVTSRSYASYTVAIKPKLFPGLATDAITGGTQTTSGSYKIHTFTSTDVLIVKQSALLEYLIVAGGGGGGSLLTAITTHAGGGGGAGGVLTGTVQVEPGEYVMQVGAGGPAISNGSTSAAFGIVADGGGFGGYPALVGTVTASRGADGGSGGGSSNYSYVGTNPGGGGTVGQGFDGGTGTTAAGGGGGATALGGSVTSTAGGAGGAGITSTISGSSVTYAGGGGGGATTTAGGAGGAGGGGAGAGTSPITTAGNGTANTGGGGGGAKYNVINAGGSGGSGIVIIRYLV